MKQTFGFVKTGAKGGKTNFGLLHHQHAAGDLGGAFLGGHGVEARREDLPGA